MTFKSLRLQLARYLVVVNFVWPFINTSYFFQQSTVEINLLPVVLAIALVPELLLQDVTSLLLISIAIAIAAIWGPSESAPRLMGGAIPCLFLTWLYRDFRSRGKELIPQFLPQLALFAFAGFCIVQHFSLNVIPIIPGWITSGLAMAVPRYMDAPYDDFGLRGVQGWASEPSSAAMTCFAFSIVAIRQQPKSRWLVLFGFAVLTMVNKSLYGMLFLLFLGLVAVWGVRRELHALLVVLPIGAVFSFFLFLSGRVHQLRENLLMFGLNQDSNRELQRFAQIVYPILAFPGMYHPVSLFGSDIQPLGLLPLLMGYGGIIGCIVFYRLIFRNFRLIDSQWTPLAIAAILVLSFMSSANFVPVLVAFAYATAPTRVGVAASDCPTKIGYLWHLKSAVAESAKAARQQAARGSTRELGTCQAVQSTADALT